MKVRFLEPCHDGLRTYQPGDVAFINDDAAQILIEGKTAEMVRSIALAPLRITVSLNPDHEVNHELRF